MTQTINENSNPRIVSADQITSDSTIKISQSAEEMSAQPQLNLEQAITAVRNILGEMENPEIKQKLKDAKDQARGELDLIMVRRKFRLKSINYIVMSVYEFVLSISMLSSYNQFGSILIYNFNVDFIVDVLLFVCVSVICCSPFI